MHEFAYDMEYISLPLVQTLRPFPLALNDVRSSRHPAFRIIRMFLSACLFLHIDFLPYKVSALTLVPLPEGSDGSTIKRFGRRARSS